MDEEFIRNRITELRLKKGASEYQMSLALGQNRSYIQGISSGRSLPSMAQFLKICDYFEITPLQFFDAEAVNPQLIRKAMDGMRKLKDEDLITLPYPGGCSSHYGAYTHDNPRERRKKLQQPSVSREHERGSICVGA